MTDPFPVLKSKASSVPPWLWMARRWEKPLRSTPLRMARRLV